MSSTHGQHSWLITGSSGHAQTDSGVVAASRQNVLQHNHLARSTRLNRRPGCWLVRCTRCTKTDSYATHMNQSALFCKCEMVKQTLTYELLDTHLLHTSKFSEWLTPDTPTCDDAEAPAAGERKQAGLSLRDNPATGMCSKEEQQGYSSVSSILHNPAAGYCYCYCSCRPAYPSLDRVLGGCGSSHASRPLAMLSTQSLQPHPHVCETRQG